MRNLVEYSGSHNVSRVSKFDNSTKQKLIYKWRKKARVEELSNISNEQENKRFVSRCI